MIIYWIWEEKKDVPELLSLSDSVSDIDKKGVGIQSGVS